MIERHDAKSERGTPRKGKRESKTSIREGLYGKIEIKKGREKESGVQVEL